MSREGGSFRRERDFPITGVEQMKEALKIDSSIPLPEPGKRQLNGDRIEGWCTEKEVHPRVLAIRRKLLDNLQYISFENLLTGLEQGIGRIEQELQGRTFAVVHDQGPHKSRRWVWELQKNRLPEPEVQLYLRANPKAKFGAKTLLVNRQLNKALDEGVNTFLFTDDTAYTGEQLRTSVQLLGRYLQERSWRDHPEEGYKIVISVPFAACDLQRQLRSRLPGTFSNEVVVLPSERLKTANDVLSEDDWSDLDTYGSGKLDEGDRKTFSSSSVVVLTEHSAPDPFTIGSKRMFHDVGFQAFQLRSPYKRAGTEYYENETAEFQRYAEENGWEFEDLDYKW